MAGATAPLKGFDPLDLANLGSEETLLWFRAAELKHGRVAMLASTGYVVQGAGFHFPGELAHGTTFESLSGMKPFDAWDAVPDAGKAQILFTIFIAEGKYDGEKSGVEWSGVEWNGVEWSGVERVSKATVLRSSFKFYPILNLSPLPPVPVISESKGVHYTKGGDLPTIVFPPIDFSGVDAGTVATKRNRELNNGRLAMIAIMSYIAAANIPGSVPALVGNPAF